MAIYRTIAFDSEGVPQATSTTVKSLCAGRGQEGIYISVTRDEVTLNRHIGSVILDMKEAVELAVSLLRMTGHPPDVVRSMVKEVLSKE